MAPVGAPIVIEDTPSAIATCISINASTDDLTEAKVAFDRRLIAFCSSVNALGSTGLGDGLAVGFVACGTGVGVAEGDGTTAGKGVTVGKGLNAVGTDGCTCCRLSAIPNSESTPTKGTITQSSGSIALKRLGISVLSGFMGDRSLEFSTSLLWLTHSNMVVSHCIFFTTTLRRYLCFGEALLL
jgi:hypothetical protein